MFNESERQMAMKNASGFTSDAINKMSKHIEVSLHDIIGGMTVH
jgi:hypothetical protein